MNTHPECFLLQTAPLGSGCLCSWFMERKPRIREVKELIQGCTEGSGGVAIDSTSHSISLLDSQGQDGAPGQQAGEHSGSEKCGEYSPLFSSPRADAELEAAGDYVKVGETGWGLARG